VNQRIPDLANRLRNVRGVLVDSNVLIDVATNAPPWAEWSIDALEECSDHIQLVINPIIFAEVSIAYSALDFLNAALPVASYVREPLPWEAAFLAGKAFLTYRQRGGARSSPMPDFYIGAHAAVARLALLTRDAARYRTYFPSVELLTP
jgi:hypothetical protein